MEKKKILTVREKCLYLQPVRKETSIEIKIYCGMEQLVARWAHNPKVVGSSPAPATKIKPKDNFRLFLLQMLKLKGSSTTAFI